MKKIIYLLIYTYMVSIQFSFAANGIMSGSGNSIDPYLIEDYSDLKAVGVTYGLNKVYQLSNNIDATASAAENDGAGFIPIGNQTTPFTGKFYGAGYVIDNLKINRPTTNAVGLFGVSTGEIYNLGLTNASITGSYYVGVLVGGMYGGSIDGCYCQGTIVGALYVGGLAGGVNINCSITDCYTTNLTVNCTSYTGGLIGCNLNGSITNCYTTSSVSVNGASDYTGGIAGANYNSVGSITTCINAAEVNGNAVVGGLAGENNAEITGCINNGTINGTGSRVGGLVGDNFITDGVGVITGSSSTGTITGGNQTGGLAGKNSGSITGSSTTNSATVNGVSEIGGLVGSNSGTIQNCNDLCSTVTASADLCGGIAGLNSGTINICLVDEFQTINGNYDVGGIVGRNISIVSSSSCKAVVTGNHDVGGAVGRNFGTVTSCSNTGAITGTNYNIGGLVGRNKNLIEDSHSTGNVSGTYQTGGLVGLMGNTTGSIDNCYATGNVNGTTYVGGLVGFNNQNETGTITGSSSSGTVTGTGAFVGGLVGYNYGSSITDCISSSIVSGLSDVGGLIGYNNFFGINKNITGSSSSGDITSTNSYAGGLIGSNINFPVSNCISSASVDAGYGYAGGLIGYNDGSDINGCSTTGMVSAGMIPNYINDKYSCAGGLTGYNSGSITNSSSMSTLNCTGGRVGGIAGLNDDGTISKCHHSLGCITSSYVEVGGLVGYNFGTVEYSYNTGVVSGVAFVGGLVGYNNYRTLRYSYNTGSVATSAEGPSTLLGGVAGLNYHGIIIQCYSNGSMTNALTATGVAGFAGKNDASTITESFWNTTTSCLGIGIAEGIDEGVTGLDDSNMKNGTDFINANWNTSTWYMDAGYNDGYPYLFWQNPGGTPLPVELTSFTAASASSASTGSATAVVLNWTTATEVNNYGFEVERQKSVQRTPYGEDRSQNSEVSWEEIGFVEGSGNSNSPKEYSFVDACPFGKNPSSGNLQYRLKQIDNDGKFTYSEEVEIDINFIPGVFILEQNYPNPFNPTTVIMYQIPTQNKVVLKIFDVLGREIKILVNEQKDAGTYKVEFNAPDLPSGRYFYQLTAGNYTSVKKLMLIK